MLLFRIVAHIAGRNPTKKVDIIVGVKLGHLPFRCGFCTLYVVSKRGWVAENYVTHKDLHFLV